MKFLGRFAFGIAILLFALAAVSWFGVMLVAPYFFLIPAVFLVICGVFLANRKSVPRN